MKKNIVGKVLAIAVIIAGISLIVTHFIDDDWVYTDDAQVEQYMSPINIKVPGYIKKINFTEHQRVSKGDTLLIIDDREYVIALKQAEASLKEAKGGQKVVANTVTTVSNSATVYDASIEEAELRVGKLQRDYERYSSLLERKATTPVVVERYKTELDMAKAKVEALKRQRSAALSSVGEVTQRKENTEAVIMRAEAAVELARLNLSYTVITAPADGYLGRRTIEEGQLVSPGQTITTFIPNSRKWVVANFKETQMVKLHEGQAVEIKVDAIPEKVFNGKIVAISSATGSKYSMVPTDNSTGNFVKIQQRIPVRIEFVDSISLEDNKRMAAGMMCEINVKLDD